MNLESDFAASPIRFSCNYDLLLVIFSVFCHVVMSAATVVTRSARPRRAMFAVTRARRSADTSTAVTTAPRAARLAALPPGAAHRSATVMPLVNSPVVSTRTRAGREAKRSGLATWATAQDAPVPPDKSTESAPTAVEAANAPANLPASPGLPGTHDAPFTFDAVFLGTGTFRFFCEVHGSANSGMRGTITVVP